MEVEAAHVMQNRLVDVLDVVLRVPPLFVMDEFLRIGFGLTETTFTKVGPEGLNLHPTIAALNNASAAQQLFQDSFFARPVTTLLCKFFLCCLGFSAALCTFLLNTRHLLIVYCHLLSTLIVVLSYWSNLHMTRAILGSRLDAATVTPQVEVPGSFSEAMAALSPSRILDSNTVLVPMVANYAVQMALGVGFGYLRSAGSSSGSGNAGGGGQTGRQQVLDLCVVCCFAAPTVAAALPLPASVLEHLPAFATVIPLLVVKHSLWTGAPSGLHVLRHGVSHTRAYVRNFGLHNLLEAEWTRINVPCVLRTFWVVRVGEQIAGSTWAGSGAGSGAVVSALIRGCETLTAVLGMTSVISRACHFVGCALQRLLLVDEEDDRSIGTVSAILFFILALQTGLTTLEPEKRFVRLCRNFCLLFTALLHFVHNMVNPLMMSLSASHNPAMHRHVRALSVCLFLLVAPTVLLFYLWTHHTVNTWLLAVSAFSVEVVVKVLVSLAIYALFLADAWRATFWEGLDDYVYYIRAFGNTVEFFFGIFLFFNGAWILLFESGGTIRAIMMCIHAYFNIWCEARSGWSVFMKRRTAVNKINSLPEATAHQLATLDDVCAICYQEMRSAKITHCRHFFHSICLRKWLYVQDRCPLCHEILYKAEGETKAESAPGGIPENNPGNMEQLLGPEFG